jgi:hypothetical protein
MSEDWIDGKLGPPMLQIDGVDVARRSIVNLKNGPSAAYNPTTGAVDVDFTPEESEEPDPDLNERLPVLCVCTGGLLFTGTGTGVLTKNGSGAIGAEDFDGITPEEGDRVLLPVAAVVEAGSAADAWIYVVTDAGAMPNGAGHPWVLTRADDSNASAECQGGAWAVVENGDTLLGHQFQIANTGTVVLNTTELVVDDMGVPGDESFMSLARYTVAQLLAGTPSASVAGRLVWVTNDATGAQVACSGGASPGDWHRGINATNDLVAAMGA